MALVGSRLCAALIRIHYEQVARNHRRWWVDGAGLRSRTGMLFARRSPVALETMHTAHAHAHAHAPTAT